MNPTKNPRITQTELPNDIFGNPIVKIGKGKNFSIKNNYRKGNEQENCAKCKYSFIKNESQGRGYFKCSVKVNQAGLGALSDISKDKVCDLFSVSKNKV